MRFLIFFVPFVLVAGVPEGLRVTYEILVNKGIYEKKGEAIIEILDNSDDVITEKSVVSFQNGEQETTNSLKSDSDYMTDVDIKKTLSDCEISLGGILEKIRIDRTEVSTCKIEHENEEIKETLWIGQVPITGIVKSIELDKLTDTTTKMVVVSL